MKMKTKLINCTAMILCLVSMTGCSNSKSPEMVNEVRLSLQQVSNVTISYDEENITFFESDDDDLVVKEYMTENKDNYHAIVLQKGDDIHISEGGKPILKGGFTRYIEVYLPTSYHDNLKVTTTDGSIDISDVDLDLSTLRIDSTSGTIQVNQTMASEIHLSSTRGTMELGNLTADSIRLETTSGDISCEELNGAVTYTSTSGNIEVQSAIGSGSYKANNSGQLKIIYTDVTGDLYLFNKNDNIELTLPADLEFKFSATTKNGTVSAPFQENTTTKGNTTSSTIGSNPVATVEVETKNGDISVTQ